MRLGGRPVGHRSPSGSEDQHHPDGLRLPERQHQQLAVRWRHQGGLQPGVQGVRHHTGEWGVTERYSVRWGESVQDGVHIDTEQGGGEDDQP